METDVLRSEALQKAKLDREIEGEIARRVAIHKANVARLQAARAGARALEATVANRPLVMLAQGDSWFDYPLNGNAPTLGDTDVIAQLRRIGDMPPTILNLAVAGDTAVGEMSLKRQAHLIRELSDASNWPDGKPDAILFSAGGNDIAGEEFCIFLDFNDGKSKGLNEERFKGALQMVRACYLAMFAIRDRVAPGVPIFGHAYDFPIPNGAHPICVGPWLKPSLDYCNWSTTDGTKIVRKALVAFNDMLSELASKKKNNFHLVETQGTLKPEDWANELHPFPAGFKMVARKFAGALEATVRRTFGSAAISGG